MTFRRYAPDYENLMTIERFIQEQQRNYPRATGTFTRMLQDMAMAGKIVARETMMASLNGLLGKSDTQNVHGEQQARLDLLADDIIYKINNKTERLCAMASEEHEEVLKIPTEYGTGNYVLLFDPLDGSSNIDVNVSVGTIFSIHRKYTHGDQGSLRDLLQNGHRLIAAGYIAYGSSTMMVYTTGVGVHGFTLDPTIGEFLLTHENLTMPDPPEYYSINYGKINKWTPGVRQAISWLQGDNPDDNLDLSLRYTGTLVGDFHRDLLKGGVYMYPGNLVDLHKDKNSHAGKIRLMYEAQSLAFIAQQAGGYASDGVGDILDIEPHDLHQRVPLYIGHRDLVKRIEGFIKEHDDEWLQAYLPYRNARPANL